MINQKSKIQIIYVFTFILAACSILYSLIIAHAVTFFAGDSVISYTLTIGIYLASMGLGAFFCDRHYRDKDAWTSLFHVEFLLSILGAVSVMAIHVGHMFWGFLWVRFAMLGAFISFVLFAVTTIFLVGFLSGIELPLLIRLGKEESVEKNLTNRILATDYFGSLIGAVIFPLILLRHFEIITLGLMTAVVNIFIAIVILSLFIQDEKKYYRNIVSSLLVFLVFMVGLYFTKNIQQYFLKKYYYFDEASADIVTLFAPMNEFPLIERHSSPYQKIDIIQMADEDSPHLFLAMSYSTKFLRDANFPQNYGLYLDGTYQIWTGFEELYHEYFAHVPVQLNKNIPENVLILGGGDGLLARELLKYPQVRNITLVELDKMVIDLVRTHPMLRYAAKGAFSDPRLDVVIADAYQYMRKNTKTFDAIYIDFPQPTSYSLGKLFSKEFYKFVQRGMAPEGYVVFDAPGANMMKEYYAKNQYREKPSNQWAIFDNTLKAAGFQTIVHYSSHLEDTNRKALKIVDENFGSAQAMIVHEGDITGRHSHKISGRKEMQKAVLGSFVKDYSQGFIYLKQYKEETNKNFIEYGIPLYVLNKYRYPMAFSLDPQFPPEVDERKVNSIMRPSLPDFSVWWQLKKPF